MNIDELTKNIRKISSEKNVQELAEFIQKWKTNEQNTLELKENVERYLGNEIVSYIVCFFRVLKLFLVLNM